MNTRSVFRCFALAAAAGCTIAIGGTVFLSCENRIAGSLLFAVGLYIICTHGLNLFTGKVGYLLQNPPSYLFTVTVIWFGNLFGTGLTALALRYTRIAGIGEKAAAMCEVKLADGPVSLFVLGIFCGLLMYAGVEGYKHCQNPLLLFACVSAFILSGFEHCIADMFYFFMAGIISPASFGVLLIVTLGNTLGGILIPAVKLIKEA